MREQGQCGEIEIPAIRGMYVRVNSQGREGEQHHERPERDQGEGERGVGEGGGGKHYPNRVGGRRG